ncbi:hypothetical protein Lfu02_39820 [Longispora fulva]|uniref:Acyl-CoA synthetase (AMP-forming)/AMP-acid ligase II n=1 Tax=Longispora fulva TaxID=619741 RepID=A0A8J7G9V1_9ACTN|nr:aldehyde dehydrogenase family protein [Longispora fulva]MBG6136443.1 acyl-CoA synthetase (AMP-forming)/AMP-acid ligase II [Longispora fulva]GIG59610.1 hypothetical protein Lfu02_39820 [Longispora fulva]
METPSPTLVTATAVRTAAEVEREALRLAARLRGTGVAAGDRVLLKADNSVEVVTALLALVHLGASIVLLDDRQTEEECHRAARVARVRWSLGATAANVPAGATPLTFADLAGGEPVDCALNFHTWQDQPDALVTWSSGSTGLPKGVVRSGAAFLADLERTRERMGYRPDDVLLPLVPFSHFYGLTLVLIWWRVGATLVVAATDRLDQALRVGVDTGVTVVDATPSTYHSLLNLTERRPQLRDDLSTVRMWCVGGAPLGAAFADRYAVAFGLPLLDGYGSNEAGNVALACADNAVGCGRPMPGVEVTIVGEDGKPVHVGHTGEIVVRTPALMAGYLADDGSLVPPPDPDAWRTQDLGYWDSEGNLYVVGRKLAVHRLGHTLYPEAIERRAEACGRPVKIVSVDDERRGCQLVFVVADPDGGSSHYWRREIDALLPAYERPNRVMVVEQFPLNGNGKPDMAALKMRALAYRTGVGSAAVPYGDRVAALGEVVDFLRSQPEKVYDILTEISVRKAVELEIEGSVETLAGAVEEVVRYGPDKVPQLAVFMSSNVLLYSYVLYALVPSLFVEKVVLRPSSQVGSQTRRLHELLAGVHGLPIELSEESQRDFVEGTAAESRVVVFTGAYANAENVRTKLRKDQLFLFFGQGINPFVVGPDAEHERAVEDAVRIRMLNSGQDCFGPDIFLVHKSTMESFVEGLTKRLAEQRYGEYGDPDVDYGPLCYDGALKLATEYLPKNAEYIVRGGSIDFRTGHVEPTVLVRDLEDGAAVSEFFSPIFNVVAYDDETKLREILASPYFAERAMGAMLYGLNAELVEHIARRHTVAVNSTLLEVDNGNSPFGGKGIMANYVMHRGKRIAEPLLISKTVAQYGKKS